MKSKPTMKRPAAMNEPDIRIQQPNIAGLKVKKGKMTPPGRKKPKEMKNVGVRTSK